MFDSLKGSFSADKGGDIRELFFFLLFIFFTYQKFYQLENAVTPSIIRTSVMRAAVLGLVLCLAAVLSLSHHKIRFAATLLLSFLLSLLAVTDMLHMRYFADMFTFRNIALASQVMEISSSVMELSRPTDLLWFSDIPLLAAYPLIAGKLCGKNIFRAISARRAALSLLIFAAGAAAAWNHISIYDKKIPGVLTAMWNRPAVFNNIGAMPYHAVDAWNTASDLFRKGRISESEVSDIGAWFAEKAQAKDGTGLFGAAAGKNLIVIQVESLQDFVVGLKLEGREITPNLNKFLKESVYFSNTYNQTASGNSSDAEFLSNTGMYPAPTGVAFTRFAANKFDSLPRLLSDNGYSTLALHGDRPGFWNRNNMYSALGFAKFASRFDFEEDEIIGMGISDKSFFRQSLDILAVQPQPFYALLVTLTSHHPFNYPAMLRQAELDTGELAGQFMGDYLTAMRYADEQLGVFIAGLRDKGLLDNSLVVIFGDHAAVPPSARSHLEKLVGRDLSSGWAWRSMNKVPLIVRIPGRKPPSYTDSNPAGLVDVAVTAASLLGLSYNTGFGTDLFTENRNEPVVFSKGSYVTGDVYVEPALGRATNLKDGGSEDYAKFSLHTAEAKKRLAFSNKILVHDLMPRLDRNGSAALARENSEKR